MTTFFCMNTGANIGPENLFQEYLSALWFLKKIDTEEFWNRLAGGETVKEKILNNTQTRVFNYIKDFGSITTLQACNDLGETRLSARIFELKDKGIPIGFEWIEVKNRYKETRRVKKYFFEERR